MITPYKKDIESRIIDNIRIAQASIYIAVAWFTNKRILDVLIEQITSHPQLSFQIVVDDNKTNQIYFFNRATEMSQAGIIIKKNINKRILHDKFIVIDKERVISGSYNFTEKANSNNENIILAEVPMVAKFYARLFEILTNNAYIDESIELLLRYPAFAQ